MSNDPQPVRFIHDDACPLMSDDWPCTCNGGPYNPTTEHRAEVFRAGGGVPGWLWGCPCGACPDVVHDDAQAAAMAAAAHVLENRPTETTDAS